MTILRSWSAAVVLAAVGVTGAGGAWAADAGATAAASVPSTDEAIRSGLGLRAYRMADAGIRPDDSVPGRVRVDIDLGAGVTTLVLDTHSLRAPDFQMIVHGDNGPIAAEPPAITTFRGTDPATGAAVAASVIDGRISAAVRLEGAETLFIQPLSDALPGAGPVQHVVYGSSDVRGGDWRCGADAEHECPDCDPHSTFSLRGPGGCTRTTEIIFDADYPFYQQNGSSATATTTDIENICNQVDAIYGRDVDLGFTIRQIMVRTIPADPYTDLPLTAISPTTLLNRISTIWGAIPTPGRDLVHLMTGRDLAGSTIGVAWVGVVCRSPGNNTGLSQSRFTTNLSMRTILTAHEIGHNFGSSHDGSGNFVMAPSVSSGQQQVFSPGSISVINAFTASNGSCLAAAGPEAANDTAATQAPSQVTIDVLANDSSACGYTLALSLPSSSTTRGGSVSISVGTGPGGRNQVRYTPPTTVPTGGLSDSFTYRITEGTSGTVLTATVGVTVTGATTPPPCDGDFNGSGAVTVQDVFDFLGAYFSNDPDADINGMGGITVQDVFDFLAAYFTPCG